MVARFTPPAAMKLVPTVSPSARNLWPLLKRYCHGYSSAMPKSELLQLVMAERRTCWPAATAAASSFVLLVCDILVIGSEAATVADFALAATVCEDEQPFAAVSAQMISKAARAPSMGAESGCLGSGLK